MKSEFQWFPSRHTFAEISYTLSTILFLITCQSANVLEADTLIDTFTARDHAWWMDRSINSTHSRNTYVRVKRGEMATKRKIRFHVRRHLIRVGGSYLGARLSILRSLRFDGFWPEERWPKVGGSFVVICSIGRRGKGIRDMCHRGKKFLQYVHASVADTRAIMEKRFRAACSPASGIVIVSSARELGHHVNAPIIPGDNLSRGRENCFSARDTLLFFRIIACKKRAPRGKTAPRAISREI